MNKLFSVLLILTFSSSALARSINEKDLIGEWVPTGKMPREENAQLHKLVVNPDLSARYIPIGIDKPKKIIMECEYKPSSTQKQVFVFYCFHDGNQLFTLSLGGWVLESGYKELFGFEYWLSWPAPAQIYNGLPVSLKPVGT